jgi:demethylmenaquinone methyltransferase/2-methoxy-6-polyprenyl-1,4-benzoquinol methylase
MLELNRTRFGRPTVEYVQADLFDWEPRQLFDAIFVGFFVSHTPPDRFAAFWSRLATWLAPGGEVFLVDDAAGPARPYSGDVVRDGPPFAHRRHLPDDREYTIVKVFYEPKELNRALDAAGWVADLRGTGEHFLYGAARPR